MPQYENKLVTGFLYFYHLHCFSAKVSVASTLREPRDSKTKWQALFWKYRHEQSNLLSIHRLCYWMLSFTIHDKRKQPYFTKHMKLTVESNLATIYKMKSNAAIILINSKRIVNVTFSYTSTYPTKLSICNPNSVNYCSQFYL